MASQLEHFQNKTMTATSLVHVQFLQDPSLGGNPSARGLQPIMIAHVAEHIALLYRTRMESAIGMPMPELPDFKDPKFKFNDVDPRTDAMISQRAAQVVQQAPIMQKIKRTSRATTESFTVCTTTCTT